MASKVSKKDAGYGPGMPHCGVCAHWIESAEDEASETGACKLVEGKIGEDMWCKLFKPKPRKTLAEGSYG